VDPRARGDLAHPIDRDELIFPEVVADGYEADIPTLIKPTFDALWNAAGWPRSLSYDANGRWIAGA
jgi:hypothetical protein